MIKWMINFILGLMIGGSFGAILVALIIGGDDD